MIGKKRYIVKFSQFSPMVLGELVSRSYSCKPVGCKWVLKKNHRPDATIEMYKANLMAKGYTKKKVKISLIFIHILLDWPQSMFYPH
jgi:hypothetical protein